MRREKILEPDLEICDAHHHLWERATDAYCAQELAADIAGGHRVTSTVYVEYLSGYRTEGPPALRPVGETEFALRQAKAMRKLSGARVAGIVGHADLTLGRRAESILLAHVSAGRGLFRGVRHVASWDPDPSIRPNHLQTPEGLLSAAEFREGLSVLAEMGLLFETWVFHPQLPEVRSLAEAMPDLTIVVDHLGGPIAIGRHSDREASLAAWRLALLDLSTCPNVFLKLGGLGLPALGLRWHRRERPPTSSELARIWGDEVRFAIDLFGPHRCMFESNFPVDSRFWTYALVWNAYKRMAAGYDQREKASLFRETAWAAYGLAR